MTSTRHTNVRLPHFMGYRQTLQTHNAVSGQYYSLLTEYSIKPWEKIPQAPIKLENVLFLLIRIGKSLLLKWVKYQDVNIEYCASGINSVVFSFFFKELS